MPYDGVQERRSPTTYSVVLQFGGLYFGNQTSIPPTHPASERGRQHWVLQLFRKPGDVVALTLKPSASKLASPTPTTTATSVRYTRGEKVCFRKMELGGMERQQERQGGDQRRRDQ